MNGIELKVPIRLYWDVSPAPAGNVLDYPSLCRDILSLRILSINLSDLTPCLSEASWSILQSLKGRGAAVSLTVAPESLTPDLPEQLAELGVRALLVRVDDAEQLPSLPQMWQSAPAAGICFDVTAASWRQLPDVLRYCRCNGISLLSLPMQRLQEKGPTFQLTPGEKTELAALLEQEPVPEGLKLTIHDPFLWKIFFPRVSFPDGGCQAANTMLYISPAGDVYPCPTLPISIGSLRADSFRDLVLSEMKKRVRREIQSLPAECGPCAVGPTCKGGCRGRAYVAAGRLDAADPGCRD